MHISTTSEPLGKPQPQPEPILVLRCLVWLYLGLVRATGQLGDTVELWLVEGMEPSIVDTWTICTTSHDSSWEPHSCHVIQLNVYTQTHIFHPWSHFFPQKCFPLLKAINNEAPRHPGLGINKQLCSAGGTCTLWEANTTYNTPYSVSIWDRVTGECKRNRKWKYSHLQAPMSLLPPHPWSTNAKLLIKAAKDTHGMVWDTSLSGLNETQAIDHTHFPRPGRFIEQMVLWF